MQGVGCGRQVAGGLMQNEEELLEELSEKVKENEEE
jgi:hypothetical protein